MNLLTDFCALREGGMDSDYIMERFSWHEAFCQDEVCLYLFCTVWLDIYTIKQEFELTFYAIYISLTLDMSVVDGDALVNYILQPTKNCCDNGYKAPHFWGL